MYFLFFKYLVPHCDYTFITFITLKLIFQIYKIMKYLNLILCVYHPLTTLVAHTMLSIVDKKNDNDTRHPQLGSTNLTSFSNTYQKKTH